ncbi:hypothetical protein BDV93DRAFT_504543 [Ceratobasidium sp. AG-I]|nr:hypothetical protein BDV93DRAFT_504543 [Ceratobasidium sp. AG-I]
MLQSTFTKAERNLLLSKVEQWQDLKGTSRKRNEEGDLVNPKDGFIDDLIEEFFSEFPERDIARQPDSETAFTQKERDKLHSRLKQYLYNQARPRSDETLKPVKNPHKYLSVVSLFKQRYQKAIMEQRDILETSRDPAALLRAYNKAVAVELKVLEVDSPDKFKELQDTVEELRESVEEDFEHHDEDLQKSILALFPTEIVRTVKDWERRTGASIYVMTVFKKPGTGPEAFDYASTTCGKYTSSDLYSEIFDGWTDWMRANQGALLTRDPASALPSVYPNSEGRPTIPDLRTLQLGIKEEKCLMRRFFKCAYLHAGHIKLSYKAVESRTASNPGSVISASRMPKNYVVLRDMKDWTRAELNGWIEHLRAGQTGKLDADRIFQFRSGDEDNFDLYRTTPHIDSTLKYTEAELLYARRMESETEAPGSVSNVRKWNGLPPARTTHLYHAYKLELYEYLMNEHQEHSGMNELLRVIATMERYGPIHLTTGLADGHGSQNAHILPRVLGSMTKLIQPAAWLPAAFFDREAEDHPKWALATLRAWINVGRHHVHSASNTVLGGPLGVRNVAFALSRVLQNLSMLKARKGVPDGIRRVVFGAGSTWSQKEAYRQVGLCVDDLRRDLLRSTSILQLSLSARSQAFENQLLDQLIHLESKGPAARAAALVADASLTSGVPNSLAVVKAMLRAIECREQETLAQDESLDASRVVDLHSKRSKGRGRRAYSDDAEEHRGSESTVILSSYTEFGSPRCFRTGTGTNLRGDQETISKDITLGPTIEGSNILPLTLSTAITLNVSLEGSPSTNNTPTVSRPLSANADDSARVTDEAVSEEARATVVKRRRPVPKHAVASTEDTQEEKESSEGETLCAYGNPAFTRIQARGGPDGRPFKPPQQPKRSRRARRGRGRLRVNSEQWKRGDFGELYERSSCVARGPSQRLLMSEECTNKEMKSGINAGEIAVEQTATMVRFFTTAEVAWLRSLAEDYRRFREVYKVTGPFLKLVLLNWFEQFPYRHPRFARHIERNESDLGLLIFGDKWKGVYEKIRHRMNGLALNKGKGDANDKKMQWYEGEAFWEVAGGTPYSLDPVAARTERLYIARMDGWPSNDFASTTERRREQALLDLPDDLNDTVNVLHRHTGAEIFVLSAWQSGDGTHHYYE